MQTHNWPSVADSVIILANESDNNSFKPGLTVRVLLCSFGIRDKPTQSEENFFNRLKDSVKRF
jgi:hypothetical protein